MWKSKAGLLRFLLDLDELISCTEQEIEITKRMKKGISSEDVRIRRDQLVRYYF